MDRLCELCSDIYEYEYEYMCIYENIGLDMKC